MARIGEAEVIQALKGVAHPRSGRDIVSLGIVQGLQMREGNVQFLLQVDPQEGPQLEPLRQAAEKAVLALPGISSATAILTAHSETPQPARSHQPQGGEGRQPQGGEGRQPQGGEGRPAAAKPALPGLRSIVAVGSGKGGVGKSTTAANLALSLRRLGLQVGLLDADIYGPSQPRLLGLSGRPQSPDGKRIVPHRLEGMPVMSIGFLVAEDTAMIWRGPMVQSALMQMLRDVEWGELDCLVVDLPPGTGDAQLTLAQQVPLTGAVIVSTPQDLALLDVKKAMAMFRRVDVPILGLVENMSLFICPNCRHETHIFAHGGARAEAEKQAIPFLGEVPLDLAIRESSDAGRPVVLADPEGPVATHYLEMARRLWEGVEATLAGGTRQAPRIEMR